MKWQQVDINPVTVVACQDQDIADGIDAALARGRRRVIAADQAVLQRQLANHEPKCANCQHWAAPPGAPRGMCALKPHSWDKTGWSALHVLYTTDLSVCSAWAPKS
jgi:hypothetical protein